MIAKILQEIASVSFVLTLGDKDVWGTVDNPGSWRLQWALQ